MRTNIYYWKCDSPESLSEKRSSFFKEKYDTPHLEGLVTKACKSALGGQPSKVVGMRVDGNHLAFVVNYGAQQYFFRADFGTSNDNYMVAESQFMKLASAKGIPVPRVLHTDVTQSTYPLRFQIMELIPNSSVDCYHREGSLKLKPCGLQLGQYLRKLHGITLDGFGFLNTSLLRQSGQIKGLDLRYADYFYKRLDDHIGYLQNEELLTKGECAEVLKLFSLFGPLLEIEQGVAVHRDMALWNVLGTTSKITAIIDWDDAISGDPADDIGTLYCFYEDVFMDHVLQGYWGDAKPSEKFYCRVWLHTLRNMLWKTKLRHSMGYFEKGKDFFLSPLNEQQSLREHTITKLKTALERVRRCS